MRESVSLLGPAIDALEPLPRSVDTIRNEDGEIVAVVFHIDGVAVAPVRFNMVAPTPATLMSSVLALRKQDAAARRSIRRAHRKRFGRRQLTDRLGDGLS